MNEEICYVSFLEGCCITKTEKMEYSASKHNLRRCDAFLTCLSLLTLIECLVLITVKTNTKTPKKSM